MTLHIRQSVHHAGSIASSMPPMIALGALVTALASSGPAMAEHDLLDDFVSRNDDLWERLDRSDAECDKPAVFDASSGAYRIESGCR